MRCYELVDAGSGRFSVYATVLRFRFLGQVSADSNKTSCSRTRAPRVRKEHSMARLQRGPHQRSFEDVGFEGLGLVGFGFGLLRLEG